MSNADQPSNATPFVQENAAARGAAQDTPLSEHELDQVVGGDSNLMNACCTGKHIPRAELTI
jgi:type VI protein secretion system component Hcp